MKRNIRYIEKERRYLDMNKFWRFYIKMGSRRILTDDRQPIPTTPEEGILTCPYCMTQIEMFQKTCDLSCECGKLYVEYVDITKHGRR